MRKWLVAGMVAAFIGSISVFILMLSVGEVKPDTLQFELAKALLQVGLISAIGAALSLLAEEYQGEQRKAEKARDEKRLRQTYRQQLLMATFSQANAAYTDVKRARRLLRGLSVVAKATDQPVSIMATHYDEQTLAIIDAQLEFENLADDVRTNAASFTSAEALAEELDRIEDYLSELISEYEDERRNFAGQPPQRSLDKLPHLENFLASYRREPTKFQQGFQRLKKHHLKVKWLIRKDLDDLAYSTEDSDVGRKVM